MTATRTKSLSTKVTPDEYARLQDLAGGQPLGEWTRAVLVRAAAPDPIDLAMLAEIAALRTILLNLLFRLANGQRLTVEEMQALIDRADADKWRKAREQLHVAAEEGRT
jgi:hypothetical protein